MTSTLTISRLTKRFDTVEALSDVSLELKPGMPADADVLIGPDAGGHARTFDRQGTKPGPTQLAGVPRNSTTQFALEATNPRH